MTTDISLQGRLKAVRKAAGYKTAKAFIQAHDIPPSTYSQHETGRRSIDEDTLKNYSRMFGVSFDWLKNGGRDPFGKRRTSKTKESTLADETFILQNPALVSPIDESLLAHLIKGLSKAQQDKYGKLKIDKLAKDTSALYANIIAKEDDKELQVKLLNSLIKAYQKLL